MANRLKSVKKRLLVTMAIILLSPLAQANVFRTKYFHDSETQYLIVEVLADDLIHFEISATGTGPDITLPLPTSPMVDKTDYPGASKLIQQGKTLETAEIKLEVDTSTLCVKSWDKKNKNAFLTQICPTDLTLDWKGLTLDPGQIKHVYGLGQQFKRLGSADGDWLSHGSREAQPSGQSQAHGNGFMPFGQAGMVGNVQFPIMYALGDNNLQYALFIDNVYKHQWDFTQANWQVNMWGDKLRYYIMTGKNLIDLREDYMALTGHPPVPAKKSFGLWVSEFGYKNWHDIDDLKDSLRTDNFPLDGFVLDLFWFGGIEANSANSAMGKLDWDISNTDDNDYYFPSPEIKIADLSRDHIGLVAIEESYVNLNTDTFSAMQNEGNLFAYGRTAGKCDPDLYTPIHLSDWFGHGAMIDWTNPAASQWIHDNRRYPNLTKKGIFTHWTDLGEPEKYDADACYHGIETDAKGKKNTHGDIHNLYAFMWVKSIYDGYYDKRAEEDHRSFVLSRSGTSGIQRFGTAIWSGDIGANLALLATHSNAQLHMSFSGIDYYGADVGGFRREAMPYNAEHSGHRQYEDEMYTQWFANAAWFDIPIRPHTDNAFQTSQRYETSPNLVGSKSSNLANIRQRYALIPYYYSLAHRAHLFAEPVIPPLVYYYQNDRNVRNLGHQKLIGEKLLVGIVASHGEYERDIYLPAARWINYHTNEWVDSKGEWVKNVPVYQNGLFTLPVYAKAGGIFPQMHVDTATKDAFGNRKVGAAAHDELIVKVYADIEPSHFTLYEDDGETLAYDSTSNPVYSVRTSVISQKINANSATVTVAAAQGTYAGALNKRQNLIKLVVDRKQAIAVKMNGVPLVKKTNISDFESSSSGWFNAENNLILAKSDKLNVTEAKKFTFTLSAVNPVTSANFICDNAWVTTDEAIYVTGNTSSLGNWDPAQGMQLNASIYWQYIRSPPLGHHGPGPSNPVWTGLISGLAATTKIEWKCVKRRHDGGWTWQAGSNNTLITPDSDYAGHTYGKF
ncbi:DUF5110 domain-containing protein [Shewanella sp. VB17]|uniref:TIM-barrel domain-containing protein n=1 Tax=Shewanella sp. VB17 TaxID=2739432 RepID=UPI001564AA70|nr:TIM-barrel domain-containing protein [Shewanella sp. VB17]NRD72916.1 DUF5110 domain-containing protein [Shewanella sp. VB17]